jgi:hypothetical protein
MEHGRINHAQVKQLFHPADERAQGRTKWMPGGKEAWELEQKNGTAEESALRAGVHYEVKEVGRKAAPADDIALPFPGDNPFGEDLRDSTKASPQHKPRTG